MRIRTFTSGHIVLLAAVVLGTLAPRNAGAARERARDRNAAVETQKPNATRRPLAAAGYAVGADGYGYATYGLTKLLINTELAHTIIPKASWTPAGKVAFALIALYLGTEAIVSGARALRNASPGIALQMDHAKDALSRTPFVRMAFKEGRTSIAIEHLAKKRDQLEKQAKALGLTLTGNSDLASDYAYAQKHLDERSPYMARSYLKDVSKQLQAETGGR